MGDASILRPNSLAHIVFRTRDLPRMLDFWATFLGAERVFENEFIAFLRYDQEHHRVAIIQEQDTGSCVPTAAGLHHVAFSYPSLRALLRAHQERKRLQIVPGWCVNHGPTTSIYYKDPDGNAIETQVDNFDTIEEANAFMTSDEFRQNPIGTDINPEELLRQLCSGICESALKRRVEIGGRESVPAGV
ncbi:Glyoxalase/Bleomycin resistance protein/Dihydroxybiphenyl dioxygenase [Aspergillus pseudoustus]|uniref:Glyoxalase/Bleomycin resistance protein/Dihydroxybiphenyl dioxygenase n=1 Tax=Aspergillus pseudoustus TaxID=1810923 RepID=A0ABR4J980_9EURO